MMGIRQVAEDIAVGVPSWRSAVQPIPMSRASAEPAQATIPSGTLLVAPRYDGMGKLLAEVPTCWCCRTPYRLERLQERKGETYAWLEPGCHCLDVAQAVICCGLCVNHCRCLRKPT